MTMKLTKRKPFTPGEILQEEFILPYNLTQKKLAELTGITRRRVNEIVRGKRAISPDTALRLGKLFNMTPEYWLNLQNKTNLWNALHHHQEKEILSSIKPLRLCLQST
ncbi:MAG: HigA family addiction module antitoxin [Gammaproteobacteria bacterium]|nr:HigA family addiction module antitoxin [Gammaproteobacteria bacterium]